MAVVPALPIDPAWRARHAAWLRTDAGRRYEAEQSPEARAQSRAYHNSLHAAEEAGQCIPYAYQPQDYGANR